MTKSPKSRPSLRIVDTTLRDGEQTPGVAFSALTKKKIAQALAAAGVDEIEIGTPAMGRDEVRSMRSVTRLALPCLTTAWCRARTEDIDAAAEAEVGGVHFSLPASRIHQRSLGKTQRWVLEQLSRLAAYARRSFSYVSVGMQDASRADVRFLIACLQAAEAAGVDRLRIADTVGIWNPLQVAETFAALRAASPRVALGFHAHNDLGMATANTLAAAAAGAASVDVTVNGLGERAGNAPLEEVVMALHVSLRCQMRVDTRQLGPLAALVARAARRALPPNKPIVGSGVFRHESGIHVQGMLADRRSYEPFAAETVGHAGTELVIGKHSGRAAVDSALRAAGIQLSAEHLTALMPQIRGEAQRGHGKITIRRLQRLAARVVGATVTAATDLAFRE